MRRLEVEPLVLLEEVVVLLLWVRQVLEVFLLGGVVGERREREDGVLADAVIVS